jgi:hypothetical protein
VTNPETPVLVNDGQALEIPYLGIDLAIHENHVYAAAGTAGLLIFDVTDKENPVIKNSVMAQGDAYGVLIHNSKVFVSNRRGLLIIEADPENPVEVGRYTLANTTALTHEVAVIDHYVYLLDDFGLRVLDISNMSNIVDVAYRDTPGWSNAIEIKNDRAYISVNYAGIQIYDISNPENPVLCSGSGYASKAYDMTVANQYAFIADVLTGLTIMKITDPYNPVPVSILPTIGYPRKITHKNGLIYIGASGTGGGMYIFKINNTPLLTFEEFVAVDQGKRFAVDFDVEYEGFDWGYTDTTKQNTWGSWTIVDSSVEVPGFDGSGNWMKARAADVGKGAKITNQNGFVFKSMKLFTDTDRSAFLDEVAITYRTIDNVTSSRQIVTLQDDQWISVTAADLGIEGVVIKALWFNGPGISNPNAAKFGLDNFEFLYIQP